MTSATTPSRQPVGQVLTFAAPTASSLLASKATRSPASIDAMRRECLEPGQLWNPWRSPGCSPVLRAILDRLGVPYTVLVEVANDGDPRSHLGGNAIDVVGAIDPLAVANAVRTIPELFAAAVWNADTPDDGLYVWDGQLVDASAFSFDALAAYTDALHLSSSPARLYAALGRPAIHAALGTP